MTRNRIYIVVLLLLVIGGGSVCAQANSDYKVVAKKKIRTATCWKITKEGDTTAFLRYSYDVKGNLIEAEELDRNEEYYQAYYYDTQGNDIGGLSLSPGPSIKRDTIIPNNHRLAGWLTVGFDTADYMEIRYDHNGNMVYYCYRSFLNGAVRSSRIQITKGDTTFHYVSQSDCIPRLNEFTILNRNLLGGKGYSMTTYRVNKIDTTYIGYNLFLNNRRGDLIKTYADMNVLYGIKRGPHGTIYRPESDTTLKLTLYYTYKNKYTWNGKLKCTIRHSVIQKEPDFVNAFYTKPFRKYNTLEMLEELGSVTYEYY